MPKATKSKGKRTHVLGGCGQCRRRHVKCDQSRPTCQTCDNAHLLCDGYSLGMRWMGEQSANNENEANTKVRRQLYTEEARASMSSALTTQMSSKSVNATLNDVDERAKRNAPSATSSAVSGPFGVIDFQQPVPPAAMLALENESLLPLADQATDLDGATVEARNPSNVNNFRYAPLDFTLQWDDIFALDFEQELANGADDLFLMDLTPDLPLEAMEQDLPDDRNDTYNNINDRTCSPDLGNGKLPNIVLEQSQTLLKHFQNHIIPSMASLPFGVKSPWKIQNLASAAQTLAELTYLDVQDIKHAKISNLYGLLACSAYQLECLQRQPGDWQTILNLTRHAAKKHLQLSLREEISGPGKAKYKDQLMAMLSLVSLAVISGQKDDARKLIIDAERLLRTRGLAKKFISRKCRMLHHCYTWTRIIGESTYVLHDYAADDVVVDRQLMGSGTRSNAADNQKALEGTEARLDNFLRFESQHEEAVGQKEPEVGLRDIHLDDPRDDQATMYMQIYGLPEAWLSLLSRTTKLANVMDAWRMSGQGAVANELSQPAILQKRAKIVESMVCSFAARDVIGDPTTPNFHMIKALTAALVIYFYRRIRDVNSWIMQSHVDNVIASLKDYDQALHNSNTNTPGTAWPAFIAGCEASSKMRREALVAWTDKAFRQTALAGYKAASAQMREVWRRRDVAEGRGTAANMLEPSGTSATWMAVSRDQGEWILLC